MYRCAADSPWNSSSVADWPLRPRDGSYWNSHDYRHLQFDPP